MNDIKKTVLELVEDLIDRASISIIGSIDAGGYPNTKAMLAPRKREGLKIIYFSTNTSSMRVKQFRENPESCVYFYNEKEFTGVMLLGEMEVLQDNKSKEMLWKEGDELYYPQGINDPDYCVLRFVARRGRFYRNLKSEDFKVKNKWGE